MIKIYILLLINVVLAASGQLLLKHGMNLIGKIEFTLQNIPVLLAAAIKSVYIWLALFAYGLGMLLWLFILSKVKLSIAYPATALIFILIVIGSWIILKEQVTLLQSFGIGLILIGMFFVFKESVFI